MTRNQNDEILKRLDRIERDLGTIKLELAETRGAFRLAKFVVAMLGVSGLGGITAWLMGQGSEPDRSLAARTRRTPRRQGDG